MNTYRLSLLIIKHKAKLENLINSETDFSKILKESKKLNKYINQIMIYQIENKKSTSS